MQFRAAVEDDLSEVAALLAQAELPPLESTQSLSNVIVALDDSQVVGSAALEVYGRSGLLRSMVIAEERRSGGLGRELFRSLLSRVYELGLKELFLPPTDADGFFQKLGFKLVPRERAPGQIRDSRELREVWPETETLLRLTLG